MLQIFVRIKGDGPVQVNESVIVIDKHNHTDLIYWFFYSTLLHVDGRNM
jgi:hypothetical protein